MRIVQSKQIRLDRREDKDGRNPIQRIGAAERYGRIEEAHRLPSTADATSNPTGCTHSPGTARLSGIRDRKVIGCGLVGFADVRHAPVAHSGVLQLSGLQDAVPSACEGTAPDEEPTVAIGAHRGASN